MENPIPGVLALDICWMVTAMLDVSCKGLFCPAGVSNTVTPALLRRLQDNEAVLAIVSQQRDSLDRECARVVSQLCLGLISQVQSSLITPSQVSGTQLFTDYLVSALACSLLMHLRMRRSIEEQRKGGIEPTRWRIEFLLDPRVRSCCAFRRPATVRGSARPKTHFQPCSDAV